MKRYKLLVLILAGLLPLMSISAAPADWTTYHHPDGWSVSTPPNWSLADDNEWPIFVTTDQGQLVTIGMALVVLPIEMVYSSKNLVCQSICRDVQWQLGPVRSFAIEELGLGHFQTTIVVEATDDRSIVVAVSTTVVTTPERAMSELAPVLATHSEVKKIATGLRG